jgi:D-serine deaminase-like pyridoxal phosphate-dependent protein
MVVNLHLLYDEMRETPYVLIDGAKMQLNIKKMAAIAGRNGVALRPHVKTHKIPTIARAQVEAGAAGITVAKISEAEVMADAGLEDIFIAYPLVTDTKIRRAMELARRLNNLTIGVDSLEGARRLSAVALSEEQVLNVRLEVDTGLRRTGVPYEGAVGLAREIHALGGLELTGIYTYRGAVLGSSPTLDLEGAGVEEGRLMASLAVRIRGEGIELESVSLGSTPTAEYAAQIDGVTEIRPGTYVFYDRMQARLGACSLDECAATVVATVVSRPSRDLAVIDSGSKTFATDVPPGTKPLGLEGFGHVLEYPDAGLERLTEEHGMLAVTADHDLEVGDTLHVIPNHICSTVNLHDAVYMADGNGAVEELQVSARGKVR